MTAVRAWLGFALIAVTGVASAQDNPDETPVDLRTELYTDTRWALQMPEGSYDDGCGTGYMALQLRANGFFIFNNRVTGVWALDKQDRIRFRTRQGQRFFLTVNGQSLGGARLPLARVPRSATFVRCSA